MKSFTVREKGSQEQVSILLARFKVCLYSPPHPCTLALNFCVMLAMEWVSELGEAGMCGKAMCVCEVDNKGIEMSI